MSSVKCPICKRVISSSDTVVRMVVEIAKRDSKDSTDVAYFSEVLDWESFTVIHLACAMESVREGREMPYGEEISALALFEEELDTDIAAPVLTLVHGKI